MRCSEPPRCSSKRFVTCLGSLTLGSRRPVHDPDSPLKQRSGTLRVVTAIFGAFLILLAFAILLLVDRSMIVGGVVAALVLGYLGGDACLSAVRGKRALVERIGPLP